VDQVENDPVAWARSEATRLQRPGVVGGTGGSVDLDKYRPQPSTPHTSGQGAIWGQQGNGGSPSDSRPVID
jgi:hypothetical protein